MFSLNRLTIKFVLISAISMSPGTCSERVVTVSLTKPGQRVPDLQAIRMVDSLRGWTIAENHFWFTLDGGRSWKQIPNEKPVAHHLRVSWGVMSNGDAWSLVDLQGEDPPSELLRVSSNGLTEHLSLPCLARSSCFVQAADFDLDGKQGLLLGLLPIPIDQEKSRLVAFATHDGGHHWAEISSPDGIALRGDSDGKWIGNGALIVVGCDFYVTTNFGVWTKKSMGTDLQEILCGENSMPYSIRFVGPQRGWLRTYGGRILSSDDGGASWGISSVGHESDSLPNAWEEWVSFADNLHGLIAINGSVLATRNGGRTWSPVTDSTEYFWSVSCTKDRCLLRSEVRVAEFTFDK